MRPLGRRTIPRRVRGNTEGVQREERKPVIPGSWIYVGTFVGPDDPGNDPPGASYRSPEWINDFFYLEGMPVAFRHGLDGQLDMIGAYDLTLGAVSGDAAFMMPMRWARNAPFVSMFPIEIDTDIWSIAIQKIDVTEAVSGDVPVRIYWPIAADPI